MNTLTAGWYLLHTRPRQETRAQNHMQEQGFEVYAPVLGDPKSRVPLFPRYLFVRLTGADQHRYHCIRSTHGVASDALVCFNRARGPQPIPDDEAVIAEVRDLEHRLRTSALAPEAIFAAGDPVLLDSPLYQHLEITFQRYRGLDRGEVLVSYLQTYRVGQHQTRSQPLGSKTLTVPLNQLRPVAIR